MIKTLAKLKSLLPAGEITFAPAVVLYFAGDKWFASHQPYAVAFPRTTESISKILRFANRHNIPVTPRAGGHGYVGGCVPMRGGIVLSVERMSRILEISSKDFVAVVQAGVNTQTLQDRVEKLGLFYPPDPASKANNLIGGNIATNAGGPRCLKYGVTRDYVLGLEVVQADGVVLQLGGRTHKNKTGFDLHRLFVGSEGLLGVVTEATLKLLPFPPCRACFAVGFSSMRNAARAIRAIFAAGFLPAALEIADSFTLEAAYRRTKSELLRGAQAFLIIELDGQFGSVRSDMRQLRRMLSLQNPLRLKMGFGTKRCENIWAIRREFSYALRDTGLTTLNQDIVVPRGRMEALFAFAARLQAKYRLPIACFGHAGDGNIHTNIMVNFNQPGAKQQSERALDQLFRQVLAWGGSITGEHGIGLAKKRWWPLAVSKEVLGLHRRIKQTLDPKGVLNPGKFV